VDILDRWWGVLNINYLLLSLWDGYSFSLLLLLAQGIEIDDKNGSRLDYENNDNDESKWCYYWLILWLELIDLD
jgi:hypothetical protein